MQDRPEARELVEAVAQFLSAEVLPTIADPRLRFRSLIAANVLTIVARELSAGDAPLHDELRRLAAALAVNVAEPVAARTLHDEVLVLRSQLCAQIRAGQLDDAPDFERAFAYGREAVIAKLMIANPRFLERVLPQGSAQGGS